MGILGIFAYGFGLVGSVAFFQFSLYAYQVGKPEARSASYYRGRLLIYAFMLGVGGLSQLVLGVDSQTRHGTFPQPPVRVAFYIISISPLAIAVGALQMINAVYGVLRALSMTGIVAMDDTWYQMSLGFGWLVQFALQALTQAAYPTGPESAGLAPTVAAFSVGLSLMPAYLEYKMRSTPALIQPEYYGKVALQEGYVGP